MKRFVIISINLILLTGNAFSQTAYDAMSYSRNYAGGTARSEAMSGALGALGGDISVLNSNPAGLAVYRGSEFTFTPSFNINSTSANYGGTVFDDKKSRLLLNNIGYVYTKNTYNETGLKSVSFGLSYNRLSDFSSNAFIKNSSSASSMLDEFVLNANFGYNRNGQSITNEDDFDDFYERLAWKTFAIDWDDNNNEYFSDFDHEGRYEQLLLRSMRFKGGISEYSFSIGTNVNNNFFWGATLGIQSLNYSESYSHKEETPGFEFMKSFEFEDLYSVDGVGVNFKTGVIFRPIQALRIGAAIHTPTSFNMNPYHRTKMVTQWNKSPELNSDSRVYADNHEEYYESHKIRTPWRYNINAAGVFGRIGMIGAEMEILNYGSGKIMPTSNFEDKSIYDDENALISNDYKTAINLKTGAEFRLGPLYLRGGMAYYGTPFNKDAFKNDQIILDTIKETLSFSGGIGFRHRDFYMDAAYSFMKHPEKINLLYEYEWTKLQTNSNKIVVTFGFRF